MDSLDLVQDDEMSRGLVDTLPNFLRGPFPASPTWFSTVGQLAAEVQGSKIEHVNQDCEEGPDQWEEIRIDVETADSMDA
jgi:hypothetical protein